MSTPMSIPFATLEKITNGFSNDLIIGRGGYGNVYKAVYKGEVIAVKLLHHDLAQLLDDRQFNNEVLNLFRIQHPNIVRLCGYCYETRYKVVEHNGQIAFCKHIYRVLCFEYLNGGSLDKHLHAPSLAPNWRTRYNIIKGICDGLNFLHGCKPPILHLDLKPANILIDSSMVPKVADLGLSRIFSGSHTQVTERIIGTQKYMPPEFLNQGYISTKNDIFSLGVVMIEIIAGPMGYSEFLEMERVTQFVEELHTSWSTMVKTTSEEVHQVNMCINTAIRCVDSQRDNRPTIAGILDILNKTETLIPSSQKETRIPKRQMADVLSCLTIGSKNTTNKKLKSIHAKKKKRLKMTTEVDNMTNKHHPSNCMPRDSFNSIVQQVPDRETSSDVEPTLIIGRDEEKHKILSILSRSSTEEMAILPIYGIGGIGKTTLAQLVFNDAQFQEYSRVWIYVSQKFDLKKIGNSIISQLTNGNSRIAEMQMLHNRLRELFAGKSTLIVLDDMWEEKRHELEKLKAMLMPRVGSKVVIVTTRDEAIARKISRTVIPYQVKLLTNDMCWSIIKQKSSFEDRYDKRYLEHIGRDIAIKCGGVALAAHSLGYMLTEMESDQWESVRDSYIWNLSSMEDPSLRSHEVLLSLLLSYSHMHEYLQLCFSYCAVFPKGQIIAKYDLIQQWIALGLTGPSSTFDSIQLCKKYITQLLGMSFLQHSKTPSVSYYSDGWPSARLGTKDVTFFTMHDLVHDLAVAIMADQVNDKGYAGGNRCRYALLTDSSKPLQMSVSSPANLKALHYLDCRNLELHSDAFSLATGLHVLDLSECLIKKLPDSVGQLKQLRFLRAPWIQDQMIPGCVTKLSELNYLNLRGSFISELPKSLGDMKRLMHLDLSNCSRLDELPVSFAELKQLVHLDLSNSAVLISAFDGFTKLQYLNLSATFIDNIGDLSKVIGNLTKLVYLNLSESLSYDIFYPSEDRIGSLLDSISTLSNLEHLDLSENYRLSSIPESMGNLRKLHTLDLLGCEELRKLPDSMVNMVSLKVLNVETFVALDESVLSLINIASLPHFVVHADSEKCSSNIIRLEPTNPDKLTIDRLENVKSAEEAHNIKLVEKQKVKDLTFQWTVGAGRFVDDKEVLENLVPPSSVKKLFITGYESVSIPEWLVDVRHHLPNLLEIHLCNFPNCNNLTPLGQLPNLQRLSLCRMEGLKEWNTAYIIGKEGANELMFPKLRHLTIQQCDKLRMVPCLPRAMDGLLIVDCDGLLSSHSGASFPSPIDHLFVLDSKLPLHQWRLLHQLPSLRSLRIRGCGEIMQHLSSDEIIKHLSSLQSLLLEDSNQTELPTWVVELTSLSFLRLYDCKSMTSLPDWLGELNSLNNFEISFCEGIRSLPDSIQQLDKLERLTICHNPALKEWCESEENKMKLAHIKYVSVSFGC